jgi:coenzyme PQQ precursor peptide PqqA
VLDTLSIVLQRVPTDLISIGIIKTLLEVDIMWQKPTAIEMSCGCEINMYAPAEGDRPLF